MRDVGITILNVGTHLIDVDDDDHARGVVYCRGEIQVGDRWVVQAIQYRDDYERRGGHWYFVRRKHLLWYGRERRHLTDRAPAGELARAPHRLRCELPDAWPTWHAFWQIGTPSE